MEASWRGVVARGLLVVELPRAAARWLRKQTEAGKPPASSLHRSTSNTNTPAPSDGKSTAASSCITRCEIRAGVFVLQLMFWGCLQIATEEAPQRSAPRGGRRRLAPWEVMQSERQHHVATSRQQGQSTGSVFSAKCHARLSRLLRWHRGHLVSPASPAVPGELRLCSRPAGAGRGMPA